MKSTEFSSTGAEHPTGSSSSVKKRKASDPDANLDDDMTPFRVVVKRLLVCRYSNSF